MDFAIAPVCQTGRRADDRLGAVDLDLLEPDREWAVLCLHTRRGLEVAQHLAQFGHRSHAEAFLADLLACSPALAPAGPR